MRVENRNLDKVKLDIYLNNELWFRGCKKPPAKIKVKAKIEGENVFVELVEMPDKWKFVKKRQERIHKKVEKKVEKKKEEKIEEKTEEEKTEQKEKAKSVEQAQTKLAEKATKAQKHTIKEKAGPIQRKALKK